MLRELRTDSPKNQPTDGRAHRGVSLPITWKTKTLSEWGDKIIHTYDGYPPDWLLGFVPSLLYHFHVQSHELTAIGRNFDKGVDG